MSKKCDHQTSNMPKQNTSGGSMKLDLPKPGKK